MGPYTRHIALIFFGVLFIIYVPTEGPPSHKEHPFIKFQNKRVHK